MNNQFEPIFFTPPSGDTKRPRTLYKGGSGGDGGAAERKAAEDKRIADAINKLNQVFGMAEATPDPVDRNAYKKLVKVERNARNGIGVTANNAFSGINNTGTFVNKGNTKEVFDDDGYNAAVAAAQAKADSLKGAAQARETLYSKIADDTKNNAMIDLNKERGLTERDLNFMLARNGLSGGSRDIDASKDVLDTFNQGVLKASNIGLQTANNARSNDEKTRVNLINSIHAGLSDGDAQQQAYQSMANNAKQAQDDANSASLAGFFDVLKNQQERAQYQNGINSTVTPLNGDPNQQGKYVNSVAKGGFSGKTGSF